MTKNAEILSDDFLSEIGEGKSPLHIYASDLDYYRPKIEQLKRMWRELPESIKQDKDLYKSLHSKKNGQFQGAISELISAWFLNNYFSSMIKDLKVGTFTPDFYCEKDQYKLLFETVCLLNIWEKIG